jgi:hypothetical protein
MELMISAKGCDRPLRLWLNRPGKYRNPSPARISHIRSPVQMKKAKREHSDLAAAVPAGLLPESSAIIIKTWLPLDPPERERQHLMPAAERDAAEPMTARSS